MDYDNTTEENLAKLDLNEFGWRVTDHVTAMLAYWDKNEVCRFANSAYMEWFGKTPDEMIGKITIKELLGPLYKKNLPYITGALKGTTQVFERAVPLQTGGYRYSIATYYPDFVEGDVRGFYAHVADVTSIKLLEAQLRDMEKSKKREMLRSIIETQEKEKEMVADKLRDGTCQTLAYCKMMLQYANTKEPDNTILEDITKNIHQALQELNVLSKNLSPSVVIHLGIIPAIEDYISNFEREYKHRILFICKTGEIEKLGVNDKISVFRIVQDYLQLLALNTASRQISLTIHYDPPLLSLQISHDDLSYELPRKSREFSDIKNRIEYYEGSLKEKKESGKHILQIELGIT